MRIDNGIEFCNEASDSCYSMSVILRHKTIASTPRQNGLAKRFNQIILEKARCMLFSAGLKKLVWVEAVVTAAYLINRCP